MNKSSRWVSLATLLLIALLSGCVVAEKNGRVTGVGLDYAEIFGTTIGTFKLADGSEGTLRRDAGGAYSIKLQQYHKMVSLQNATAARIAYVAQLGGRTSVLVELADKRCSNNYQLLSITGSQVSSWSFGNCKDRPRVYVVDDQQYFDFPAGRQISRYRLSGDEVRTARLTPPDGYPPFTEPFATEALQAPAAAMAQGMPASGSAMAPLLRNGRVIPPPPLTVTAAGASPAPASDAAVARASPKKAEEPVAMKKSRAGSPRSGGSQPDLVFDEEVRPVRVVDLR